jgi:hypothetical protein
MVVAIFFTICKMVEIHLKKTFGYIINIYCKILKKLGKVYDDFKD